MDDQCLSCPDGQTNVDGQCASCPHGQGITNGVCDICPEGQIITNGQCESCPNGQIFTVTPLIGPSDVGGQCPSPTYKYTEAGVENCCCDNGCCWSDCGFSTPPVDCIQGIPDSVWIYSQELGFSKAFTRQCISCPEGQANVNGACADCPDDQIIVDGQCESCPNGQIVVNGACQGNVVFLFFYFFAMWNYINKVSLVMKYLWNWTFSVIYFLNKCT